MTKQFNKGDIQILSTIAKYNFLTVKQLCVLQQRSIQVIRRRLRYLKKNEFISIIERVFGPGAGRNEHITILSIKGIKSLKSQKILDEQTDYINNQTYDSRLVEHDLLLNWFLIHLVQLERLKKRFEISTITSGHQHLFHDKSNQMVGIVPISDDKIPDDNQTMIPDGVFTITDKTSNKSLLFFLEIDRGTESRTSITHNLRTLEHKINNYKVLLKTGAYKCYNKLVPTSLNGFRLLFLANTTARMNAISQLARSMSPLDFIWVTEQNKMFEEGLGAEIWWRGGITKDKPQSILNKKFAFKSPVVIKK